VGLGDDPNVELPPFLEASSLGALPEPPPPTVTG
jgi:hypothetical protein